jgi:hypothetical protein
VADIFAFLILFFGAGVGLRAGWAFFDFIFIMFWSILAYLFGGSDVEGDSQQ